MGYLVTMPGADGAASQGTVAEWFVAEGDSAEAGTPLVRVETEATRTEIATRNEGVLRRIIVSEEESCEPGTPIGIVAEPGEDISDLDATAGDGTPIESAPDDEPTDLPERHVTTHLHDDLSGRIEAGSFEWRFDVSETFGGSGGPTPVDLYLGSLSACLAASIGIQADIREVDIDSLSVTVDAAPGEGSVESLSVHVVVDAEADEGTIDRIVEVGERTCHVAELLREDVPFDLTWE